MSALEVKTNLWYHKPQKKTPKDLIIYQSSHIISMKIVKKSQIGWLMNRHIVALNQICHQIPNRKLPLSAQKKRNNTYMKRDYALIVLERRGLKVLQEMDSVRTSKRRRQLCSEIIVSMQLTLSWNRSKSQILQTVALIKRWSHLKSLLISNKRTLEHLPENSQSTSTSKLYKVNHKIHQKREKLRHIKIKVGIMSIK